MRLVSRCLSPFVFMALGVGTARAQEEAAAGNTATIDAMVDGIVGPVTKPFVDFIFAAIPGTDLPWIVLWLITAAAIFTVYFGFVQFRMVPHAIQLVRGHYTSPEAAGEVTHFQALATAVSGTVGLGNIAGVAVAVSIGGPGATFWMILSGLLGMASKFTECTLGVKYRTEYDDGRVSGGPMHYLKKGMAEIGHTTLGKVLAVCFAVCCVLASWGGGNMFQANQAHAQLVVITGGEASFLADRGWITGLVMAVVVFLVIVGGIKSIARVTEKLVPFMGILYLGAALIVILANVDQLGTAFAEIFEGAFTGLGVAGGLVGALIQGLRRATFSNEAGIGSAAIAHSAVQTKHPVTEGFVSMLEPFIDTVIICTATALVITISGVLQQDPATGLYVWDEAAGQIATANNLSGVELTSAAFGTRIGWFPYVLAVAVVLFAFSTMISWSYYGVKAWCFLFGDTYASELVYKVLFCLFVVLGAAVSLGAVLDFSDASLFAMGIFNIVGLYFLMPIVKREMTTYMAKLRGGEIPKYAGTSAAAGKA
ncbi:alanine/glycine:cation symporter family protein [Aurantimonas sp. 22II-16-19i]|uniref:alanine/glycine:cation symporter family protein n=1 Tax=Aurantimonas sp. 22II-16-19i TaxID=1317114 RepID=UPI0009F7D9D9|nr:alanine/glycine:cation symporter family protein [Aurantimonas sp. 22II-16-19i]ORE96870.1 amino acid carrier protein [Aurantimonas sp. 22II-16-19i]